MSFRICLPIPPLFSLCAPLPSSVPSCPTDPGVDKLSRVVVPQLSDVGVAMFWSPPTAHCSREAISSMLISGIASFRVGSGLSAAEVTISELAVGVGTGIGAGVGVGC